ncbi:hypothetical protein DH2020_049715 [Rehmannia glutinosa]|uniref:SBP-type domain-containing protein n=1 Tax=Rehmannia glutinosa TaxID=99300 RepID=A0ABR0U2Q0_REHGL
MELSSISGSSKRAKAPGPNSQVAQCLVDGCNADLSLCRDYHRRHKVCETHSKTAKVTIGGREQRFCQQCSRFHSLVEFDEGKRSCRKRLDGHNRRRRKPQPDSLSRNSPGLVFSTQLQGNNVSGGRLVSFSSPQILPSAVVSSSTSSSWAAGIVKSENNDMLLYNNQHQHQHQLNYIETQNSFPENSYKGVNQLQFMQNSQKMYSDDGLNQVVDSDGALSLLSSSNPPVTREFGLNHVVQPHSESLVHNMNHCGFGQYPFAQESKPLVSATDASTPHFPQMFDQQHGHQGSSSTSGSHQTLTFMWE